MKITKGSKLVHSRVLELKNLTKDSEQTSSDELGVVFRLILFQLEMLPPCIYNFLANFRAFSVLHLSFKPSLILTPFSMGSFAIIDCCGCVEETAESSNIYISFPVSFAGVVSRFLFPHNDLFKRCREEIFSLLPFPEYSSVFVQLYFLGFCVFYINVLCNDVSWGGEYFEIILGVAFEGESRIRDADWRSYFRQLPRCS